MRYLVLLIAVVGCTPTPRDMKPLSAVAIGIAATNTSPAPAPTPTPGVCENCGGDGELGDGTVIVKCEVCNGTGRVTMSSQRSVWYDDFYEAKQNAEDANLPLLVVFSSKTCVPCGALSSQQAKGETKSIIDSNYVACRLYAQEDMTLFSQYQVRYYPTQIVLVDGREVSRREGFSSRTIAEYNQWLKTHSQ